MQTSFLPKNVKWLLIFFTSFFLSSSITKAQKQYYNLQSNFDFKPARFERLLFDDYSSVKGVFDGKLIIQTDWENKPTTMLVDTLGNILYNFEKYYELPENYATEGGFWLVRLGLLDYSYASDTLILAFFDIKTQTLTEKKFGIGSDNYVNDNDMWVGKIQGQRLFCLTNNWDFTILNFEDTSTLVFPTKPNSYITDVTFDKSENKFRLLGLESSEKDTFINLYEFKANETFDKDKQLVWQKTLDKFDVKNFYKINWQSEKNFSIAGLFTDSTLIAKNFDLKGKVTSEFDIPFSMRPTDGSSIYNFYGTSIFYRNGVWFLYSNNSFFVKKDTTNRLFLENGIVLKRAYSTQNTFFIATTNTVDRLDVLSGAITKINYIVPTTQKANRLAKVITNPDSTYWVIYENDFWVKYKGTTEIFRSDSAYKKLPIYAIKKMPDSSLWVPTYGKLITTDSSSYYEFDFLRIGKDNSFKLINFKDKFGIGNFLYFDKYKKQFYVLSDSLKRYNWDGTEDKSLKCEIPADKIGSLLVNSYGSIYIGNNPYGWPPDPDPHTYKLDYSGKLLLQDLLPKCTYCSTSSGTLINFFIPYYEKQDLIVWGGLVCGEGCYIGYSYAINEENEPVETQFMGGSSLFDAYGIIIGGQSFIMKYDSTKKFFFRDENLVIDLPNYGNVDILPNGDILSLTTKDIKLFSLKIDSTIVTKITNLENQPNTFFTKKVLEIKNQEFPLRVITSDGSAADVWIESKNENIASIINNTLIYSNFGGTFKVIAQSIHGGLPFVSKTFTIEQEAITLQPSLSPLLLNKAVYFEIIEPADFDYFVKVDSVSGDCIFSDKSITGTKIGENGCTVYYSWPENNYYLAGHGVVTLDIVDVLLEAEEGEVLKPAINYPNPMEKTYFVIEANKEIGTIKMFNSTGQMIPITTKNTSNQIEIYPKTTQSGLYFVQLFDKNKKLIGTLKQLIK